MRRFQSHLLSASMCSSMTACGVACFLSGGSFMLSAQANDDPMGNIKRATAAILNNIAFPPLGACSRSVVQRLIRKLSRWGERGQGELGADALRQAQHALCARYKTLLVCGCAIGSLSCSQRKKTTRSSSVT